MSDFNESDFFELLSERVLYSVEGVPFQGPWKPCGKNPGFFGFYSFDGLFGLCSSFNSRTIPLEIHSAIPMFVIIGFTPLADGKTLASATYKPCTPQTLPWESTTPVLGDGLIRHVPIWCAEPTMQGSGAVRPVVRTMSSHAANDVSSSSVEVEVDALDSLLLVCNGDGAASASARAADDEDDSVDVDSIEGLIHLFTPGCPVSISLAPMTKLILAPAIWPSRMCLLSREDGV